MKNAENTLGFIRAPHSVKTLSISCLLLNTLILASIRFLETTATVRAVGAVKSLFVLSASILIVGLVSTGWSLTRVMREEKGKISAGILIDAMILSVFSGCLFGIILAVVSSVF